MSEMDVCCILQPLADVSDSADASGFVLSNENEVSQLTDGCFLTPHCHKFVYISLFLVTASCGYGYVVRYKTKKLIELVEIVFKSDHFFRKILALLVTTATIPPPPQANPLVFMEQAVQAM